MIALLFIASDTFATFIVKECKVFKRIIPCLFLISAAAVAADKPTLTVYTYDSFAADWGPGPAIKKAFEAECDCQLKFVALEDGVSLLNRLRMEGKNSQADVILGLDNNLVQAAEQTGLFAPSQVDTSHLTLPEKWHNKTFVPYDYGYFAFVYDKNKLKNPPKSLQELVSSKEPWRVIYQDPRTSTPGLGLMLWMQKVYGDKAPQAWQQLAQKTVTVTKGWSEAYGLFLKGEGDLVLSYTTSPAYHLIEEKKSHYAAADFSEGHYLQVEVAGQVAASKQPKLAQRFMQFIVTPAFQDHIPTGNWMYPVIKMELPAGFDTLTVPQKALQFDAKDVADNRTKWIQAWQSAVSR
ncbi:Thiamine-binding periplasmic protein [Yersinia aldovae ATCC 35236]|uniref:Thiamine-binding periplasmic protein n=1 Tax=Yersinia aldovae TaxID=29483 RepID=A0A0T9U386_YERAL|nr:Thiamine-binding periplasmic protein [Yersinia aldovae ATCC 35236]CNJ73745.1 thiamine transporter substrate binding subunit [Yersinia aldovae]CNK70009.1 thiamine transporter substrate binding subunit [Yersinia aldovae]CNL16880.1 thiamine transporter substrate binding subunit [Yersinia aldovae]